MKHLLLSLLCAAFVLTASAQGKQKLSVLYLGGTGNMEIAGGMRYDTLAYKKSIKQRTASFTKFLKSRFTKVKVMDAKDYTPEMSRQWDVTIFDGRPEPIRPRIMEQDAHGNTTRYALARYLPDDFDCAALCIASQSEEMGRALGSKNDWMCLCLAGEAYGWKKDHPIFQGPWKVNIKSYMAPTPSGAFEYCPMYGYTLPAKQEMWRVQVKDYQNTQDYRVGMVSRPNGYLDSPETEIISGGVSAKSYDAVAIGRHANFFHWGFSSDPDNLTPAGRAALANAIVYAAKFKGQHIIARKLNESIATRLNAMSQKYLATEECWKEVVRGNIEFYHLNDSIKQSGLAKKARGEKLTPMEEQIMSYDIPPYKAPTYAEYLKDRYPTLYHIFGDDAKMYADYFTKNAPYMRPDAHGYDLDIDEDVRTLAIPNNDMKLLDRCITMLEKNEQPELATRVLHRYTLCRFATANEWRQWYEANKAKLFFTESGGWLWLVNTQDPTVVGNDYSVLDTEKMNIAPTAKPGETTPDNPVALAAEMQKASDGGRMLVVTMNVHRGWHTYGNVDKNDPFIATEITTSLPDGLFAEGAWVAPMAKPEKGSTTTLYEGTCVFRQRISGTGKGQATITVSYQCCDNQKCMQPAQKTLTVSVE